MGKPESLDTGPPHLSERGARDLLNHVVEYLQYLQYHQTVQTLLAERASKRSQLNNSLVSARTQSKDARERIRGEMLRKFDEGRRDDFFTLWQQYVPASMMGFDFATQKLEFYLQVYFSIYPVLPSSSVLVVTPGPAPGSRHNSFSHNSSSRHELALRMKAFKGYLEGRGAGLAHTAEFLPYYALPYVPQPEHHPSFEGLFQSRWVDEQRLQLKSFLEGLTRSASQVPRLYVMYSEHLEATDGVPRLSPRARALRASTRAHPHGSPHDPQHPNRHSRDISRGSGGLGHPQPGMRASGPAGSYGAGSYGGILAQHEAASAAAAAAGMGTPGRRGGASPLPPRGGSRPPSGLEARNSAMAGSRGSVAAAAAALGAVAPPRRVSRTADGGMGDSDDLSGLIQDDEDDDGDAAAMEEEREERARAAAVLRRQRDDDDDDDTTLDEKAMAEALRSPSSRDLPVGGFPPAARHPAAAAAAPADRGSVALSLERLGLAEDAVFRDSVQLLGSTLGGSEGLDEAMVSELMAAGAAAASGGSCTGLAPLDYSRVKRDLQGPDTLLAARLLQALRWRLTRSHPGADRWGLIASWIEVDLLDCHSPSLPPPPPPPSQSPSQSQSPRVEGGSTDEPPAEGAPCSLLRVLAASPDPRVREEVVRLANAIASDRLGRNYLMLPGGSTVTSLMGVLRTAKMAPEARPGPRPQPPGGVMVEDPEDEAAAAAGDAEGGGARKAEAEGRGEAEAEAAESSSAPRDGPAVQQALVALQKLSLKRVAQTQMIRQGAVAWVVEFLQDLPSVSPIAVEYGTALLMNLCLRSTGLVAATAVADPLLKLCESLLRCDNEQVRTYIHGTLYSVFGRAAIRDVANGRGTAELLEEVAQSAEAPFAAQSQYILRQLYMPDTTDPELAESGDEAGQDGDADPELEEGLDDAYADVDITPESLERVPGEPCGEELLCAGGYLATTKQAREHLTAVRSSVAAAAAAMAAAGKSTLRGSVLLGTLPKTDAGVEGRGTPLAGRVSEQGQEGEEEEEAYEEDGEEEEEEEETEAEEVVVAGTRKGMPAAGGEAAGEPGPLVSEPSSSAPSAAGDGPEAGAAGAETIVAAEAYATLAVTGAGVDGQPGPEDAEAGAVPAPAVDVCPSPSPSRAPSRGGSRRPSCAASNLGSSTRPSSAYVTLATSTASTSIMAAARALEAARVSGGGGGSTLGASTRRRSAIRPITPSSPAAAAAVKQPWDTRAAIPEEAAEAEAAEAEVAVVAVVAAPEGEQGRRQRQPPPPQLALHDSRMGSVTAASSMYSETGAGPSASPALRPPSSSSQSLTQSRPPLPPTMSTSAMSSVASPGSTSVAGFDGAAGGSATPGASTPGGPAQAISGPTPPRLASRAQSPGFRPMRGSSASARRSSETGSGSQGPAGAVPAAAAAVAPPPPPGSGGEGTLERSSATSLGGAATAGAASEALVPSSRLRRTSSSNVSGVREGGSSISGGGSGGGGRVSGAGTEEGQERTQRRRWEPPPSSAASSAGGVHDPDIGLQEAGPTSRPGTAASAADGAYGSSSRPGTAASTAPADAPTPRRSEGGVSSAAPSPAASLSASPAAPLPPHGNHHHHHHHNNGRADEHLEQQQQQPGRHRGRPASVQGQPFPITAANPDGFGAKQSESNVVGSVRSSQANSSANVTPRSSSAQAPASAAAALDHGGGGVAVSSSTTRTPRGLPRPPPGPGHVADPGADGGPQNGAAPDASAAGPRGSTGGGLARADSTRNPTPPSGRTLQQRSRMGPPTSGPAPPGGVEDAEAASVFAARRQLPRTPPGSNG